VKDNEFWEECEVELDGEPRYDSYGYYSSPAHGKGDESYDQYPTNRNRQSKGKGGRRGRGRKGDQKGRQGDVKGKDDRRGKGDAKAGRATGTAKATTATGIAVNTVSKTMATGSLGENCGAPSASGMACPIVSAGGTRRPRATSMVET
jgi:hypothetical protein